MVMKLAVKPLSQSPASACQLSKDADGNTVATWIDNDGNIRVATFVECSAAELERDRIKAYPILIP
jgi:hypothetical protein